MNYPVRCLCFELGDGFESLAELVGTACQRLQARDTPFNLLIADHGARVFLIPQKFSHRAALGEIPDDVVATGINPAVFEISGHLLYKQQEDYDAVSEAGAYTRSLLSST
jgi:GDP-L-galactose phosphorylase